MHASPAPHQRCDYVTHTLLISITLVEPYCINTHRKLRIHPNAAERDCSCRLAFPYYRAPKRNIIWQLLHMCKIMSRPVLHSFSPSLCFDTAQSILPPPPPSLPNPIPKPFCYIVQRWRVIFATFSSSPRFLRILTGASRSGGGGR